MNTIQIGWEIDSVDNKGGNLIIPVKSHIQIVGYQIDHSMGFPAAGASGFSEVLSYGVVTTGLPTIVAVPAAYIAGPFAPNTDFGASSFLGPSAPHGGAGLAQGFLFSSILKTYAPGCGDRLLQRGGMAIDAPAGSYIAIHMDHYGVVGDWEMQGVLFYENV